MATRRDLRNGSAGRARHLRKHMTNGEVRVWEFLRASRTGFRFRRQYPVGSYVVDFYCPELKMAVEVDGERFHSESKEGIREEFLTGKGIFVHHIHVADNPDWERLLVNLGSAIARRAEYIEWFSSRHLPTAKEH